MLEKYEYINRIILHEKHDKIIEKIIMFDF